MSKTEFKTKDVSTAMQWISIYLNEGYKVTAQIDKPDNLKCFQTYILTAEKEQSDETD